jgi:hypothetical protein
MKGTFKWLAEGNAKNERKRKIDSLHNMGQRKIMFNAKQWKDTILNKLFSSFSTIFYFSRSVFRKLLNTIALSHDWNFKRCRLMYPTLLCWTSSYLVYI